MKPASHETAPLDWRGQRCTFEAEIMDGQLVTGENGFVRPGQSKVSGVAVDQRYTGRKGAGAIPDYQITVRGRTGRIVKIGMLENNFQLNF